jgi:hypothetical protein
LPGSLAAHVTDAVHEWVATAPEPAVTRDGLAVSIANVRYEWMDHCAWCRNAVHVWADGGTILAAIAGDTPRFVEIHTVPRMPAPPDNCPLCGHDRPGLRFKFHQPSPVASGHTALHAAWHYLRETYPDAHAQAVRNTPRDSSVWRSA